MSHYLRFIFLFKLRSLLQLFFLKCSNFFNAIELWLLENSCLTKNAEINKDFTLEQVQSIIQPFTHDQLIKIVANAALHHQDVLDNILSIGRCSSVSGKLFIGSLGYDITSEMLYHFFSVYGELEDAFVVFDKFTGLSKGYGFVFFKNTNSALLALKEPNKKINGKSIVIMPGRSRFTLERARDISTRQVFVSNVPEDMSPGRLLEYFSTYGEIEKGPIRFDYTTGKSRGSALFVYKTAEGATAALSDPFKTVDGHHLRCRMAKQWRNFNKQPNIPTPASMPRHPFCGLGSPLDQQNLSSLSGNGGSRAGPGFSSVRAQQASSSFCPNHGGLSSYANNMNIYSGTASVADLPSGRCNGCADPSCLWFSNYPRHSQQVGISPLAGVPPLRTYQSSFSY